MSPNLKLSEGGTLRDIAIIIGAIPARKDDPPKIITKTKRLPNAIEALDNKHYGYDSRPADCVKQSLCTR